MLSRTRNLQISKFKFPKPVENVLIYEKLTPFAYHKSLGARMNPHNFGNFARMEKAHSDHLINMKTVHQTLLHNGIKEDNIKLIKTRQEGYDLLKRRQSDPAYIPWKPDIVIATGGDGTFLRASHLLDCKLNTNHIPILGINTNPDLSVGRLCINQNGLKLKDIIELAINHDEVNVIQRNRIKIKMSSRNKEDFNTKDFHYNQIPLSTPKRSITKTRTSVDDPEIYNNMTIPIMALNDVFIGERAASMVTNLEIAYKFPENPNIDSSESDSDRLNRFNDGWQEHHSQKNSGLIICTGTGSTGWSKSSNYICAETMRTVIEKLKSECNCSDTDDDSGTSKVIKGLESIDSKEFADKINKTRTCFNPETPVLGVTFREPINSKISAANDKNFIQVRKLRAKSKLTYGMISIDGTTYYDFSRGAIVECLTHPKFAINCVSTGQDDRDDFD